MVTCVQVLSLSPDSELYDPRFFPYLSSLSISRLEVNRFCTSPSFLISLPVLCFVGITSKEWSV